MSASNIAKVSAFLNATSSDICATCGGFQSQSLCEKWSLASTSFNNDQTKLLTAIVTATFTGFTANAQLVPYFNSSLPCNSRDFVNNAINRNVLVNQLVAFFGSAGVLGCTQSSFPQYTGQTDMGLLHQNMPISRDVFNYFTQQLVTAIQAQNVASSADIDAVKALLATPGITVICNQKDCPPPHGTWQSVCASDAAPVLSGTPSVPGTTQQGQQPPVGDAVARVVSAVVVACAALVATL